jgi:hypothetical protein
MVDIREAMLDVNLFGREFGGASWSGWRALLAGFYALPLDDTEADAFTALTGISEPPQSPCDELWVAAGRRGGKTRMAALVATFEAAFVDHSAQLAPGEWATILLLAADRSQARTLMRYTRNFFDHPMLRPLVRRETETGLELRGRVAIEIGTASFRSTRGYTMAAVVADEIAFWNVNADSANADSEIIAALRPALATLAGKLIAISSPYARRGALWDTYRRSYGEPGRVLVAQAPSRTMNPDLPQHIVDDALLEDPARASAEYLAQFRSDIEKFLTIEIVSAAQRQEPMELPQQNSTKYRGFVDPSGGGPDEFSLCIGHEEREKIVVDLVRGRKGNPAATTAHYCDLLRDYGVRRVFGDRYSGEWSRTEFRRHGMGYHDAPGTRSELYLSLLSALNAGRVELPPCPMLERQLTGLERRTSRGGRDMIDHAPGAHDDRANAVAGLVALLATDRVREPTTTTGTVIGLY